MHIPKGFTFAGTNCGIRKEKNDLGIIVGDDLLDVSAHFTDNHVKAAPLIDSIAKLPKSKSRIKAVVVNSGNANCSTGKDGIKDAVETCKTAAKILGVDPMFVHASSTGIIGKRLDVSKIINALPALLPTAGNKESDVDAFTNAIMTTDAFKKMTSTTVMIGGKKVTILGIAKGAGMIQPQMSPHATMLSYICTDAVIAPSMLKKLGATAVESSYNSITVDGCTSTNDTVLLMSSQKAGNAKIAKAGADFDKFEKAVCKVAYDLAEMIVKDGEGASKVIKITIKGAKSLKVAKDGCRAVCNSVLFKTAMYGCNPNVGRVTQILGQIGAVDSTWTPNIKLDGLETPYVKCEVKIGSGKFQWTMLTCDLNETYIKINADYN